MPYLRFSRDKRGYENTYVFHTVKEDGTSRPQMLYWFRTPPNVKVGRVPLDESAIREIEENNPDIAFDWTTILKARTTPSRDKPSEGPRSGRKRRPRPAPVQEPSRSPVPTARQAGGSPDEAIQGKLDPVTTEVDDVPLATADAHFPENDAAAATESGSSGPAAADRPHPVVVLMGPETLDRLRTRYAEIQARITEKTDAPAAVEDLRARAQALDPDRWRTLDDAMRGIERFEANVESIVAELG